jgi:hypothetical protein
VQIVLGSKSGYSLFSVLPCCLDRCTSIAFIGFAEKTLCYLSFFLVQADTTEDADSDDDEMPPLEDDVAGAAGAGAHSHSHSHAGAHSHSHGHHDHSQCGGHHDHHEHEEESEEESEEEEEEEEVLDLGDDNEGVIAPDTDEPQKVRQQYVSAFINT